MPNISDAIFKNVYASCTKVFGYVATWQPSRGGDIQTAQVLYKDPTDKHGLSDEDFEIERYQMEYLRSDFVGLFEAIQDNRNTEIVSIEIEPGVIESFYAKRVKKKSDGKQIVVYLIPQ